jgi:hypothetical protein
VEPDEPVPTIALTQFLPKATVAIVRASARVAFLLMALAILAFGAWFGIREPTFRGTVLYTDQPIGVGIFDQLPLRIGVGMASSAVATALTLLAVRRH